MIVLLLVVDSLRGDAPSFAGGEARTERLDLLARDGARFDDAYASAAWTVPSLLSIATGTFAHRVGMARWRHPFPRRRPTLMSAFQAAGFESYVFGHNPRWMLASTAHRGACGDAQDPAAVEAALRAPRGTDRFVFVHHWWTHLPYRNEAMPKKSWKRLCDDAIKGLARDPEAERPRQRRKYLDTIEYLDRELLPRWLDAASSTGNDVLVCVTGDHGENWGEALPAGETMKHIYDLHGRWLTDGTTRVPLVFSGRGVAPRVVPGFARGVDIAPTLLGLCGAPWPGPLPQGEGATLWEAGIAADGAGLQLDGDSLVEAVRAGGEAGETALTVTSNNAIVPAKYPGAPRKLWRRFSLRTATHRYVWDGVDGTRTVTPSDGDVDDLRGLRGVLRRAFSGHRAAFDAMERERAAAVGPQATLPPTAFPGVGEDEGGVEGGDAEGAGGASIEESMRTLGYLDG